MKQTIEELKPDVWADLEVTVQDLWDNEHPAIRQVGLLKDESGIIKFVSWERSNKPMLEIGEMYRLKGVPVNEYADRLSISIVKTTDITRVVSVQTEIPSAGDD